MAKKKTDKVELLLSKLDKKQLADFIRKECVNDSQLQDRFLALGAGTLYHKSCARKIFESVVVPAPPYTRNNIKELAHEIVTASTTVTGVQTKLSLDIARGGKN